MKKKVRVGVFGTYRGRTVIEMLAQYEDADRVAICDKLEKERKAGNALEWRKS